MDIYEIRKRNLVALIGRRAKALCASRWEMSPAHLSQILSTKTAKNLGDEVARRIERLENLPSGWLDTLQEEPEMKPPSWTAPLPTDGGSYLHGAAARNMRIKSAGGMDALLQDIAQRAGLYSELTQISELSKVVGEGRAREITTAFTGIPQYPEKVIALFLAISEAAMVGALDGDEMDAFITLIRKRRNEVVHGQAASGRTG